jgi:signal transduction histidine kinase
MSPGGTGLGLAISQRIMEEPRGKIKVKSEINKGSVFTLSFPLKKKR